jgi:Domain of unknown function (DUF397)
MEHLTPGWRKSSYSGNSGSANCVEAANATGMVLVRDTTDRDGATLSLTAGAWRAFTTNVKCS